MNVSLTPELEKIVQDKVLSGIYNSPSEVVREALRLLVERDRLRQTQDEELRQKIAVGVEQLENDRSHTITENSIGPFFESLKANGKTQLNERDRERV